MKRALVVITFLWTAKVSAVNSPTLKSILVVDHLLHTLEHEQWPDDEACWKAIIRVLNGVKNDTLWATSMWDSMQPPMGVFFGNGVNLGSYDQCLRSPWSSEVSTQYCLVEVKIRTPKRKREFGPYDSADEYLNTLSKSDRSNNHYGVGVCMPAVCSPSSIVNFYRHVLRTTHLPEAEVVTVNPENCQGVEPKPYPEKFYVFWSVIGLLMVVVIAATIYTLLNKTEPIASNIDAIAESFSMVRNCEDLLKVSTADIKVINGMRFISAVLVIFAHQMVFSLFEPSTIINNLDVDKMTEGFVGQASGHVDLVVDTFFALSGLFLAKSLLSGRQNNLLLVLLKRYLRLVSLYAVMTLYLAWAAQYVAAGPMWLLANSNEGDVCEVHWWKNLLMISTEIKTMCFGVSWYVTCDYHLAILTVVLYWIYRKNQSTGVLAFIAVGCGLTLKLVIKAFILRIPLMIFSDIRSLADLRNYKVLDDVYIKWQDRAGSYLVGIAMGWLMTKYKPAVYRNAISKRTSHVIAAVSLSIMFMVTTIGYWLSEGRMEVAVAIATNRVVWAAAICGLIGACEYGSVPVISNFLGSPVFAPLGKLSYGIYLTHFFVLQRNLHVTRSSIYFDRFSMIINVLGTAVVSCVASLILYMLVEAPCINLCNYYLSERKIEELKTKAENGTILVNGTVLNNSTVLVNRTIGATKAKGS